MTTVVRKSEIPWDVVDGTVTLLRIADGQIMELNDMGGRIWQLCATRSVGGIVEALCADYPHEDRTRIERDVTGYLHMLVTMDLIAMEEEEAVSPRSTS